MDNNRIIYTSHNIYIFHTVHIMNIGNEIYACILLLFTNVDINTQNIFYVDNNATLALCREWQMFLVTLNKGYSTPSPPPWNAEITGPMVEQSSRNCAWSMVKHVVANKEIWGNLLRNDQEDSIMAALVPDREGQDNKTDSNVPLWVVSRPQHAGQ